MRFNDVATHVAREALAIEEPARPIDDFVENLLSCHSDGRRVALMRFMDLLVARVFPEPGDAEDFAILARSRASARSREEWRRRTAAKLKITAEPKKLSENPNTRPFLIPVG